MSTFLFILKFLPLIIEAVKQAEYFIPLSGAGKAKLDFALGIIQDAAGGELVPAGTAEKAIGRVVDLANATGVFKKA